MAKFAKEVARILSYLEKKQVESYVNQLSNSDIKLDHSEILPKITDLDQRRALKGILGQ